MLINSVQFYFDVGKKYQEALVSMDRIEKHLNVRKEKNGPIKLSSIENITIKDMSIFYNPSNQPIISNIDFRFEKRWNILYGWEEWYRKVHIDQYFARNT